MQIRTVHRAVRHDRLKTTELPIKGCVAKVSPFHSTTTKIIEFLLRSKRCVGVGIKLLSTTEMIMGLGECTDHQRIKYTG